MPKIKLFFIVALSLFLSLATINCGGSGYNSSNNAGATTVTIPASAMGKGTAAFGTNPLHVAIGTKVVWYNSDSISHTATSDTAIWDTGTLTAGATSAAVTFGTAGSFPYHCAIHGAASMSGTIEVP